MSEYFESARFSTPVRVMEYDAGDPTSATATCKFKINVGGKVEIVDLGEAQCTPAQAVLLEIGLKAGGLAIQAGAASLGIAAITPAASTAGSLLTAAGIAAPVPIVGAIVAGGALAAFGVHTIIRAATKKGREAAEEVAKKHGGGKTFVREYMRFSRKNDDQLRARAHVHMGELARVSLSPPKRIKRLDRLNAIQTLLMIRAVNQARAAKLRAGAVSSDGGPPERGDGHFMSRDETIADREAGGPVVSREDKPIPTVAGDPASDGSAPGGWPMPSAGELLGFGALLAALYLGVM